MRAAAILLRRLPRHLAHLSSSMDKPSGPRGERRAWNDLRGASAEHRAALANASWRTRDEVIATSSPDDRDGDGVVSFALEADARDAAAELEAELVDAVVPSGQPAAAIAAARAFLHDLDADDVDAHDGVDAVQGGTTDLDDARVAGRQAMADYYYAQGWVTQADLARFTQVMCEPAATLFTVNDTLPVARLTARAQLRAVAASDRPSGVEYYDCVPAASSAVETEGVVAPAVIAWSDDASASHAAAVVEEWFFRAVRDGVLVETDLISVATAALVRAAVAQRIGADPSAQAVAPVVVDVCSSHAAQPPAGRDVLIDLCRGRALPHGTVAVCIARPGDADEAAAELAAAARASGVEAALLEGPVRRQCPGILAAADLALVLPPGGGDGWRTFDGRHGAFGGLPVDRFPEIIRKAMPVFEFSVAALQQAMAYTRPGGRIIYAVCSMSPLEGEAVVAAALASPSGSGFVIDAALPKEHLHGTNFLGVRWRSGFATWLAPPDAPASIRAESYADAMRIAISHGSVRTHPLDGRYDGVFICVLRRQFQDAAASAPQHSAQPLSVDGLVERTTDIGTRRRPKAEFVATRLTSGTAARNDVVVVDVDAVTYVRILFAGRVRAHAAAPDNATGIPDTSACPLFATASPCDTTWGVVQAALQESEERGVPISIGLASHAVSKTLLAEASVLASDLISLRLVLAPDRDAAIPDCTDFVPIDEPAWRATRAAFAYLLQ